VSAPTVVVRYAPHARQMAVHNATEPHVWAMMGYGTGKTTLGVIEALMLACVTHPGYEGIVAAPTFPLLFQSFVTEWARWVPAAWYRQSTHPMYGPHIDVHVDQGVSRIWLRSTVDARSVEGINAAWLVYDEASRETREDPVRVLRARVRRGYPGRQRRHLYIGPPMTRTHWTAAQFGAPTTFGAYLARVADAIGATTTDGMIPSTSSAVSTKFIVFGNPKYFFFGNRLGMEFKVFDNTAYAVNQDQIFFRCRVRSTFKVGIAGAFVAIKTAAA